MSSRSVRRSTILAGTIALLVACGSTPGPTSSGSPSPSAAASAEASVAPSVTIAPSPSVELSPPPATGPSIPATADGWQRVWPGPADPADLLATVLATDAGFVAAGGDHTGQKPAAVSSTDGVIWSAETIGGDGRAPSALLPWGDRILAAGAGGAPCAHPVGLDTWVRSPAGAWTEAPFTDLLCNASDVRPAIVNDVAVLVGSGPGDNPIVWSSADGLHWIDRGAPFAGLLPRAVVSDGTTAILIAEGPTGTWSATTTDGSTWTKPSRIPGLPSGLQVRGAFWIDGGPTIIASEGGVLGTIRSDGNGGWTTTTATGLTADQLGTITAFDGGLLAVGAAGPGPGAWVSRDGTIWRPLAVPPELASEGASIAGVAERGGRAILVGAAAAGTDNAVSSIWTGSADLVRP